METDMGSRVYVYESYYFERKIYNIIGCDRCPCQLQIIIIYNGTYGGL